MTEQLDFCDMVLASEKKIKEDPLEARNLSVKQKYRIYPAIRRGFCPSRMTSND